MKDLRLKQQEAFNSTKQSIVNGHKHIMIQAPTGFGKTVIAAAIVKGARAKGNRVIFVVDGISLIDQTVERFREDGIEGIGVIQANHELTDPDQPVQIATIQSLARRRIPDASIVLIDEAHIMYKSLIKWMDEWNAVLFIGLSATPWSKGLGKYYSDLVKVTSTQEQIDDGMLSDFKVFAPNKPDLSKVKTIAGDYHEGQLSEAMTKDPLTADIVKTWTEKGKGLNTLCYAVDRAHAKHLVQNFELAGIKTAYIDAFTERDERKEIEHALHRGDIEIVVNIGCLTKGIDWNIGCIILARPTKSEMLFVQIIGRGLRTADGKDHCLILDHTGTHERLGFVTDIDHDELDDGKPREAGDRKEAEEPLPTKCSSCHFMKPPKVHVCPNCGFAPQKQSNVEVQAGELVELKRKAKKKHSKEEKQEWYSGLLHIQQNRGYKKGWLSHMYRGRFDVWPKNMQAIPQTPSIEMHRYVTEKLIANSKRA